MKKSKPIYTVLAIISVAVICIALFGSYSRKKDTLPTQDLVGETEDTVKDSEKSPLEVLLEMQANEDILPSGTLSAQIVSPEGDSFKMSQARMYRADITNGIADLFKETICNWKFYLNEYSEEVLYRERSVPMNGDNWCGFTDTFIDKRGKLRVLLEVNLQKKDGGEIISTASAEKNYLVN